jgi:ATP-binding cassette subfamily C protein CydCD
VSDVGRRGPVDVRLVRLVPGLRRHLVIITVVAVATAGAVVAQAELLANALAELVQEGTVPAARVLALLAGVAAVRGAASAMTEWSAGRAMRATRHRLRAVVLDHAARDGDRTSSGLASREAAIATTGVDELEPYVRQFLPALTLAVAVPLIAGLVILTVDPISALLIAVTVPLIPIFMVLIGRMTERRTQRQWAVLQQLGGHFLDVVEGLPTLRLFGRAKAQRDSVRAVSEQYRAATMGSLRVAFLSAFALELIATLSVALIAVEIGLRLATGGLGLATALVVLLLAPECYLPLRRVGASFHAARSGLDAAEDLHELLERPVLPSGTGLAPTDGALVLRDVSVRRGQRTVVDALDLEIVPGSVTAVYGPTGIGKSTLIDACRGRVLDRTGSIEASGVDVRDMDPDSWADQLAVVGQRLVPVAATVSDEVRGSTTASDESVAAALDDVGLRALAQQRSDELSGGQLRRVQIARAIVAVRTGRARIVLADEPTAHLDTENARRVWRAIADLATTNGAAILVATHDDRCRDIANHVVELGEPSMHTESIGSTADATVSVATVPEVTVRLTAPAAVLDSGSPGPRVADVDGPTAPTLEELRRSTRRVMVMARPVRRRFIGAAVLGVAAEVCTLGLAAFAAWLIVKASEQPDLAELSVAILAVRAFGIGKGVFRYGERLATHDAGLRSLSEIRAAVVDRLADIAPAGIPGWERGDLLQRVVADVDRLLDLFVRVLGPMIAVGLSALAAAFITIVLDPAAGFVLVGALFVVGAVVPALTAAGEARVGPAMATARARTSSAVLAYTEGLDQLLANRVGAAARDRISDSDRILDVLAARRTRVRVVSGTVIAAAPLLTVVATLAVVGPSIPGPVLGVVVLWPLAIIELVGTSNEAASTLPSVAGAAHRVITVLDTPDPVSEPAPRRSLDPAPRIQVSEVTARWPNSPCDALGPVSLELPYGSHAKITGPSGSGKSTLAAVLVGFLPPRRGSYLIDELASTEVDGAELRERITWIQQLPWLADSTVRENLRIADPAASDAALMNALDAVGLDAWLARLPHGLDARIGRGGSGMSGGEAQRLALSRVLLADRRVIVLDEPTAHLDARTARQVLAAVLGACANRTTVLLGHDENPQAMG